MKVLLIFTSFFLGVVFVSSSCAQDVELTWTAARLRDRLSAEGDNKVILEVAKSGDVTLIPYLRQLSSNVAGRNNRNHAAYYAHIALARLGNEEAIQQILAEVDDESPAIQDSGVGKLSLVGGKVAFEKLYELLGDTKPRENTDCIKMFKEHNKKHPGNILSSYCDVIYFTRSVTAMMSLKNMVDFPPVKTFYGSQKEIELWKKWLRKNKLDD